MRKFIHFSTLLICVYLTSALFLISCNKTESGKRKNTEKTESISPEPNKSKPDYNLYVENSGSMDGYVKATTKFKNTVYGIVAQIFTKIEPDSISLNFVSDKPCHTNPNALPDDIKYFIYNLNSIKESNKDSCDYKSSDLPNVINNVLIDGKGDVNILASDCILSLNGNTSAYLDLVQHSVYMQVANHLKESPFSTVILKFNSEYNGVYYSETNGGKPVPLSHPIQRPYYLLIFGKSEYINNLLRLVDFSSFDGFQKSYYLFVPTEINPKAKILRSNWIGKGDVESPASKLIINNIEYGLSKDQKEVFQYSVAADLSFLRNDEAFLEDPENYEISKGFKIVSISKNSDINDESLTGYTHVFSVRTSELKAKQEVVLKLKPKLPSWVQNSTSENDSNPYDSTQTTQTFGFRYLIKGISEAYETVYPGQSQFSITMHLSTDNYNTHGKSSSFSWWWLILLATIVGFIIWVKTKK